MESPAPQGSQSNRSKKVNKQQAQSKNRVQVRVGAPVKTWCAGFFDVDFALVCADFCAGGGGGDDLLGLRLLLGLLFGARTPCL